MHVVIHYERFMLLTERFLQDAVTQVKVLQLCRRSIKDDFRSTRATV